MSFSHRQEPREYRSHLTWIPPRSIILAVLTLLSLIPLFYVSLHYQDHLGRGDRLTYAMIARNLARGEGFHANASSEPYQLAIRKSLNTVNVTDSPAWPAWESLIFQVTGPSTFGVTLATILPFIAIIWLIYGIGNRLWNPLVGMIAATFFAMHWQWMTYSGSGLTEPFYTALLLLWIFTVLSLKGPPQIIFSGLVLGGLYLTRGTTLFLLIPLVAWFVLQLEPKRRWQALITLGVCIGVIGSWMVRNHFVGQGLVDTGGGKLGMMVFHGNNGNFSQVLRGLIIPEHWLDPLPIFFENPQKYLLPWIQKVVINVLRYTKALLWPHLGLLLTVGLGLWLFQAKETPSCRRFKWLSFGSLIFLILGCSLFFIVPRYFYPVLPLLFLGSAASLVYHMEKWITRPIFPSLQLRHKTALCLLFIVVFANPLTIPRMAKRVWTISQAEAAEIGVHRHPYYYMESMLEPYVQPDDVVITNLPEVVGWYADSPFVLYPHDLEDVLTISEHYVPVQAIFLTDEMKTLFPANDSWLHVIDHFPKRILNDFLKVAQHDDGVSRAVLYYRQSESKVHVAH